MGQHHADGYEMGSSKRQRMIDEDVYYGVSPAVRSSAPPYSYGGVHGGTQARLLFPVVRLRGLPFDCRDSDVHEFFAGLDVVDVLLVHKRSRFSGEAYVVFGAPLQVDYALQRNRQNMGRRYIEVFRCKKQEYYNAIASEVHDTKAYDDDDDDDDGLRRPPLPSSASTKSMPIQKKGSSADKEENVEHTGVLRLRGLPFSVSKRDIIEFFGTTSGLEEENVHIVTHSDGRATGEAFVEFSGPDDARAAMKKDKMTLGSRYVELFPSSRDEAKRAAARSRQ